MVKPTVPVGAAVGSRPRRHLRTDAEPPETSGCPPSITSIPPSAALGRRGAGELGEPERELVARVEEGGDVGAVGLRRGDGPVGRGELRGRVVDLLLVDEQAGALVAGLVRDVARLDVEGVGHRPRPRTSTWLRAASLPGEFTRSWRAERKSVERRGDAGVTGLGEAVLDPGHRVGLGVEVGLAPVLAAHAGVEQRRRPGARRRRTGRRCRSRSSATTRRGPRRRRRSHRPRGGGRSRRSRRSRCWCWRCRGRPAGSAAPRARC